jgi:threonyl-tRNA synthetase
MKSIHVTLPDGKSVEIDHGTRIDEIARSNGINGNIIAAKVDGRAVDLSRQLENDCSLTWVSVDNPDGLDVLRHSTAHLMAQAVQSLFPGTQVTIGPTVFIMTSNETELLLRKRSKRSNRGWKK